MRLAFILEALEASKITTARVVLVDCDKTNRAARLILNRRQSDLANEQMMRWADYLRAEALEADYEILDTANRSIGECVEHIHSYLHKPKLT